MADVHPNDSQMANVHPDNCLHRWTAPVHSIWQMSGSMRLITDRWTAPCTRSCNNKVHWRMSGSMHSIADRWVAPCARSLEHYSTCTRVAIQHSNSQNKIMCRTPKSFIVDIIMQSPVATPNSKMKYHFKSVFTFHCSTESGCSLRFNQQQQKIPTSFSVFKSLCRKWNITVVAACLHYSIVAHLYSAHFCLRWFDESFRRSVLYLLRPCEFTKIAIIQQLRRLRHQNVHQQGGGINTVRIIPIWHPDLTPSWYACTLLFDINSGRLETCLFSLFHHDDAQFIHSTHAQIN